MGVITVKVVNIKKITFLMFYLIGFSLPVFAETMSDSKPILTCPQEIQCMVNGKIDTCYVSDDPYEIWNSRYINNYGRILKGIYKFKKSVSYFYQSGYMAKHSKSSKAKSLGTDFPDMCLYTNTDSLGVERLIGLNAIYSFFEPFLNTTSQWSVVGVGEDTYESSCLSNSPQECPLVEIPEISYKSEKNKYGGFKYYRDENNPNYWANMVVYSDLLSTCGATSVCKIDVGVSTENCSGGCNKTTIGTVTVDISKPDFVKIVNIDTAPLSDCVLKKKEPFNTIYCEPKKK